jgi:threonylcarbamoyladenosine tRNA methylthiotransferase MtaB
MNKDTKKEYTVSFITLGCKVNQYETEAMTEVLEAEGFKVLPPDEISDIYIINTCAVTKESERKSCHIFCYTKKHKSCISFS